MDVVEMDAASNRKIEDIRDLMEEIRYTPAQAKYRVFIVDEVHMLTQEAFNALLKTLEEPPSYVLFILATTEPHKLPATILSRCQRFDFHRVQPQAIAKRLKFIAEHEDGDIDDEAALMIARLADGGMRDAISILDQSMGRSKQVNALTVCETVGMAGTGYINEIANHIANKDSAALMRLISELYSNSKDMLRLCDELIGYFRNIMILCTVKNSDGLIVASNAELSELKQNAARFNASQAIAILNMLQTSYEKMSHGSNKRVEMETVLIRMCEVSDKTTKDDSETKSSNAKYVDNTGAINALLSRVEALEKALRSGLNTGLQRAGTIPILGHTSEPGEKSEADSAKPSVNVSELSNGAKPFAQWNQTLELLESVNKPAYSVLADSRAYINGKYLLIDTNGFGRDMLRNSQVKESIRGIIRQIAGIDCRLGPYSPSGAVQYNKNQNTVSPIDAIKQRAAEAGIEVEEN